MSRPLQRLVAVGSGMCAASTLQRFNPFARSLLAWFFLTATACGQNGWAVAPAVHSVSGQFIVSAVAQPSPLLHRADLAADPNLVRLEPALLAVSAERFKSALWTQLGFPAGGIWSGQIFLALHPAGSADDEVNINIQSASDGWSYRVELPDIVTRTRFARALAATLLLELANRDNHDPDHSAELPPWLTDGVARQVLGGESAKIVLSSPARKMFGLAQSRVNGGADNLDPLADARRTLQDVPALTFDQLCWPTGAQMNGDDGGAYLASAQLFVDSLLGLDHGTEKMRALLARLPGCLNWQTAFFAAFSQNFRRPLDVEKWWSLRIIRFAARDPGPHLTVAASRERMADQLAVPVDFRSEADALPEHTVVSLQDAIQNFDPAQLHTILVIKERDFELGQFRMAPPFAGLAAGYRAAIADFLGDNRKNTRRYMTDKFAASTFAGTGVAETLKKLDALDARRRDEEAKLDTNPLPNTLNPATP